MKFGKWTANAPALLLLIPCSCIAPGLLLACSHPAPGLLMVCSCPAPALLLVLLLVPPTPVWQPSSSSALYNFLWHGDSRLLW